jgi:hypothetical protein
VIYPRKRGGWLGLLHYTPARKVFVRRYWMKIQDFEYVDRFKGTRLYKAAVVLVVLLGLAEAFIYFALGVLALAVARTLPAIW